MRQLILLLLMSCAPAVQAQVFELFVADANTRTVSGATVYRVNGGDLLMADINAQLKRDRIMKEADGHRYVTRNLKQALSNQAVGLMKAAKYQLSYFPALVIDGRFVIYGTTDIKDYERLKQHD